MRPAAPILTNRYIFDPAAEPAFCAERNESWKSLILSRNSGWLVNAKFAGKPLAGNVGYALSFRALKEGAYALRYYQSDNFIVRWQRRHVFRVVLRQVSTLIAKNPERLRRVPTEAVANWNRRGSHADYDHRLAVTRSPLASCAANRSG